MSKQKTPMSELLKWFQENRQSILNHEIERKIKSLLPKEREAIINAFKANDAYMGSSDEYFNQTYENATDD